MRKRSIVSALTIGIALLFISGALYPSEAQVMYACYKGNNFRVVSGPGHCKPGETSVSLLTADSLPFQLPKLYLKQCGKSYPDYEFDCRCEAGDILVTGGAACDQGDVLTYSNPILGYFSEIDANASVGWIAMCHPPGDLDGAAHKPLYFVIQCVSVQ